MRCCNSRNVILQGFEDDGPAIVMSLRVLSVYHRAISVPCLIHFDGFAPLFKRSISHNSMTSPATCSYRRAPLTLGCDKRQR